MTHEKSVTDTSKIKLPHKLPHKIFVSVGNPALTLQRKQKHITNMKRYLRFLLVAAVFIMSAIMIDPPSGKVPNPTGKRIPIPGKPPVMVVIPGGSK